tara:strand:+ start:1314 stop:1781 length:468 start_codon:yes stop_codon:yes gene_type:complete
MIAEVSAILSTLNAVNGAINTLRDTRSNVQSLSQVFSRVTTASEGIATIEAEAAAGRRKLTPKQAMDIALAKKRISDYDKDLKDLFLMTGNMDTYNEMKRIQIQSVAAAKKRQKLQKAHKARRKEELTTLWLSIGVVFGVLILVLMGLFIYVKVI